MSLALTVDASAAEAWSNGIDGYNAFGTHDWILREAIRSLGDDVGWVCVDRALRATDDPDSLDGLEHASGTWWHVWDEWGSATWGGGPDAVEFWFGRTQQRLARGDRCGASRALGIMAHLVGEMAQPMHTDGTSPLEHIAHPSFEHAVDQRCTGTSCIYEMHFDGRDVVQPYGKALAIARAAHRFYGQLVTAYFNHGYSVTVHEITQRQLGRAANAMADLIWSLTASVSSRPSVQFADEGRRSDAVRSAGGGSGRRCRPAAGRGP